MFPFSRRFLHASPLLWTAFATATAFAQARHVSCVPVDASTPAPNPAIRLQWLGDTKAAASKFAELLAQQPNDPDLTEGSVRVNIALNNVPLAAQLAQSALAAHPDSAPANTAQGEVLFRQGKISDSDKLFARATQLDPCYAVARMEQARVAHAASMYATAIKAITVAHALNQRDPDIRMMWISTLPVADRIAELKKLKQALPGDSEAAQSMAARIDGDEERLQQAGQHRCELVSPVDSTRLPMVPIMWDPVHIETWGLDTEINGKSARLILDSGASGLVIGRAFADHAGLKVAEHELIGGFGDHGPSKAYSAYADDIKIGGLEFRDCRVDVTDRREVIGTAGLVGTDVFRHYLVSVDFPDHEVRLDQLPPRPGAQAAGEARNLDTDAEASSTATTSTGTAATGPQDRYIAPEMKEFTPIYRFGHILLIPALVNKKAEGLMELDSGDESMSLSYELASKVTHSRLDTIDDFHGLSGKVEKLSEGGDVNFSFGRAAVKVNDVSVMDHSRMSADIGTEISGFIGAPALHSLVFQIDYRDGLVNFLYDKKKDPNRAPAPGTECNYCNPGYTK
jgi:tetratricopeptide (TPR) repeat protein